MKKGKYVLLFLVVLILIAIGIFIKRNENKIKQNIPIQDTVSRDSVNVFNANKESIPSNWKTYTNNKLGFTFQFPITWSQYGEESNVVDRLGNTVAIEVNFIDSLSHTTLLISYHLPPKGVELYRYAISQYESSQGWYEKGAKMIEIAGNKGVQAFTEMRISGRGTALNPPLRLILVDFLDKQKTGTVQLQFKTPLRDDNVEVAKFSLLLSTFKFTK